MSILYVVYPDECMSYIGLFLFLNSCYLTRVPEKEFPVITNIDYQPLEKAVFLQCWLRQPLYRIQSRPNDYTIRVIRE